MPRERFKKSRQSHGHHHHGAIKNIKIAFWLNFIFTIAEIIGGIMVNSLAIISDALHDLGDSFALGLSWYLSKVSTKERTEKFSYGYKRFSLLAAVINGVILTIGSFFILFHAISRLFDPPAVNSKGMLIFAILGILVNAAAAIKLKGGKSLNEKIVSWHLIEDVLGWAVVLIVSLVMMVKNIPILDPLLSIFFTFYILWNVFSNLRETARLFLQGVPSNLKIKKINDEILQDPDVINVSDTHVWSLDGETHIFTAHIFVKKDLSREQIAETKCRVKNIIRNFKIEHTTIEVEIEGKKCELKPC